MENKNLESFVLYRNFADASLKLPAEQFKEFYRLLFEYVYDGIEPETDDIAVDTLITSYLPMLNKSINNYTYQKENNAKYGELGKEYGKKGGRPRKGETKEEYYNRKASETPKTPLKGDIDILQEKTPKNPLKGDIEKPLVSEVEKTPKNPLNKNINKNKNKGPVSTVTSNYLGNINNLDNLENIEGIKNILELDNLDNEDIENSPSSSSSSSSLSEPTANDGKTSAEYYWSLQEEKERKKDKGMSPTEYLDHQITQGLNKMVYDWELQGKNRDDTFWDWFNQTTSFIQQRYSVNEEQARKQIYLTLDKYRKEAKEKSLMPFQPKINVEGLR